LGSTIQEGYKNIRMCPKEANKDGEKTRGHDLQRAAGDSSFVQLRRGG